MRSIYSSRGKAGSLQHRAVCQRDGIAVEVDGAVVGEARKRAVADQVPGAAALDRDNRVVADGDAALGIVDDVDGAGEGAVVFRFPLGTRSLLPANLKKLKESLNILFFTKTQKAVPPEIRRHCSY